MFSLLKKKDTVEVTPVLAGGPSCDREMAKLDASGVKQPLSAAPTDLVYEGIVIPDKAPKHDGKAQAVGDSMKKWGINDRDIILWRKTDGSDLRAGKLVVMTVKDTSVDQGWRCFRHIKSIDGNNVVVESVRDGVLCESARELSDITGLAIYKINAPKTRPYHSLAASGA